MRNILFIITKSCTGGAQKWVKEQVDIFQHSFSCHLATNEVGWLTRNCKASNTYVSKLIEKKFSIKYLFSLNIYVKKNNIKLIIASSANAGVYARMLRLINPNVKVIYVSHGWSAVYTNSPFKRFYKFVEFSLSYLTDLIICVSQYDKKIAERDIKIRSSKLVCITNSITPPAKTVVLEPSSRLRILTLARLAAPKRHDLLIAAVEGLEIDLHIVGDGPLRINLEARAIKNVFFHGEIENFCNFGDFDVFCLLSDSEGLPLSALEAMSSGLPLILSNVGGCGELISGNGYLVQNTVEEIRNAIKNIQKEITLYGSRSKMIFDQNYNLNNQKYKYEELYLKFTS